MKKNIVYSIIALFVILLGIIVLKNNNSPKVAKGGKIVTIATIFPIQDMIQNIGGEYVTCTSILPPAANPHTFEPTPRQIQQISKASIIFKIGLGFEYWSDQLLTGTRKTTEVVILSNGIKPLKDKFHHTDGEDELKHKNKIEININPHIWLDPVNVIAMCQDIKSALIEQDPSHKNYYENNFNIYKSKLEKLDAKIRKQIALLPQKKYVTFHPTWGYFDRRYGTDCVGVIEQSTGKEATPLLIKNVINSITKYGIKVIIAEPQFNAKTAMIIAQETGTRIVYLDSIGDPKTPSKNSYLNLMDTNIAEMQKVFR